VSAGTGYLHYEYDQPVDYSLTINPGGTVVSADGESVESSPDAYTYFVRGKWNLSKHISIRVKCDWEDNSEEDDIIFQGRASLVIRS